MTDLGRVRGIAIAEGGITFWFAALALHRIFGPAIELLGSFEKIPAGSLNLFEGVAIFPKRLQQLS